MCGLIAYFGSSRDEPADTAWVSMATAALGHRGPDDAGWHAGDGVALGFRRLAIMDPTERGHQPMQSADKRYLLVFNGEIYNFWELRSSLAAQGCTFRTSSDTEVLLELLARRGADGLAELRGM